MKTALKVVLVGAVVAGGVMTLKSRHHAARATDGEQLVVDRIWIDHFPRGPRDVVQVFAAIDEDKVGVFNASSQWKGAFELFKYQVNGATLKVQYPQTGEGETIKATARRCTDNDMDFCLELGGGTRGVAKYYSQEGWELRGVKTEAQLRARVDALVEQLESTAK